LGIIKIVQNFIGRCIRKPSLYIDKLSTIAIQFHTLKHIQPMKRESNRVIRGLRFITLFIASPCILSAQIAVPGGRCDTSIKHAFISALEYKKAIGKAVLILPLDTHAVSGKGEKRYKSQESVFYKSQDLESRITFSVSGAVATLTDVRLVRKKGIQYLLYTLVLKSDTLYYKYEFYGRKSNHLISPFLILDYAQCVKEKHLNRKVVCTKDTVLQSFGSHAQIQAAKGEEWAITDYAVVRLLKRGAYSAFGNRL
jgi:hypothetical protein